ncbi:MAG: substrate-binding domain-containing protein [Bacteroidota bacterium]|jgi:LacI family transcriptional regulator
MTKRATSPSIKLIAAKALVSIGTVDRVLHNRKGVSEKTRVKIQRIVSALGYTPNIYARNLSLAKTYHFGVLMPKLAQDSGYWQIPVEGMKKAARELAAYKVNVSFFHFDRYSEASFKSAFQRANGDHLDGLLIAPVLSHAAEKLLPAIPHRTPYVFFDSNIPGANSLSFIGQDPFQSGLLAAGLMLRMMKTGGRVAIVKVTPEDFHINERIRGFQAGMQSTNDIRTLLYEVDSQQGNAGFDRVTAKILGENRDLVGMFVSNAWTHPFAHHISSSGRRKKIFIVGYDLVEKNIELLKQGCIDFLISQRPEMQGYEGIYSLYRHGVLREKVTKKIMVPIDILTKENIGYYQVM